MHALDALSTLNLAAVVRRRLGRRLGPRGAAVHSPAFARIVGQAPRADEEVRDPLTSEAVGARELLETLGLWDLVNDGWASARAS